MYTYFKLIFFCTIFFIIGCHNNSHLRTQRALNKSDNVISASTVVNLGGNYDPNNILGYSELAGGRIEASYLIGTGGSEIGPYIGFGIGLENFITVLGFDFRKYTRYQNSLYDKKIGAQIEANFSRHGTVFHFRPSFSTITNKQKKMYWGVQGMIALGSSLLTEVWWYENDGSISTPFEEEDLWYLNDANSEITYDFFSSGFGLSSGYEFNVANFRFLKKKNISFQFQIDISLITNIYHTDFKYPEDALIDPAVSKQSLVVDGLGYKTGLFPLFGLSFGTNLFKPHYSRKESLKPLPIPQGQEKKSQNKIFYDPETGEKINK